MAMQLSSEQVHLTRNYNTSLAQLLSADDAIYPQYAAFRPYLMH